MIRVLFLLFFAVLIVVAIVIALVALGIAGLARGGNRQGEAKVEEKPSNGVATIAFGMLWVLIFGVSLGLIGGVS